MRIKWLFWMPVTALLVGASPSAGQNYPPVTPWHLADVWWLAGAGTADLTELSVDFEVIGELEDGVLLYIAPIGLGEINGIKFYGGVQTRLGGWPTKESRDITILGRGGIFSRWFEQGKPVNLEHARGDRGTHYESAGYEGLFASVRQKIDWGEGRFTYRVRKEETGRDAAGSFAWFGAYLYDHQSRVERYIGSLKFEGSSFVYANYHAAFVEVYGALRESEIPKVAVVFSEPQINGRKRRARSVSIMYPDNGYQSSERIRYASSVAGRDQVVIVTIPSGVKDGVLAE